MTEREPIPTDEETVRGLVDAVVALNPAPREWRWSSLALNVVDAVWSIGALYYEVVVPLVNGVAAEFGVETPSVPASVPLLTDPLPLSQLRDLDVDTLLRMTNRQRTSTRGGILKADAVIRHAYVLLDHGIDTLTDAISLMEDAHRFERVDSALSEIPGDGTDMVRRGYLWMLVGNDDLIKPDRMVLRWLRHYGANVNANQARQLITTLAPMITELTGNRITPWEIDHALWQAGRSLR